MKDEKLRIMVIDDAPIVGKRLKPALEKTGAEVEVFTDPNDALRCFEEAPFPIVVADIRMDGMDGLEVLERVLARTPETKVILVSGYATVEVVREALSKGAFDFIAKPFKPGDLRAVIERAAKEIPS